MNEPNTNRIIEVPNGWITTVQLAEKLQVTRRTIDNLCHRKAIPYTRVGRLKRFDLARVKAALEAFTTKAIGEIK